MVKYLPKTSLINFNLAHDDLHNTDKSMERSFGFLVLFLALDTQ